MASAPIVKALLPGLSKPEFAHHLRIGRVGLALLAPGNARIGKIKVADLVTHRFELADINSAFDLLRSGEPSALRSIAIP